MTEKKVESVIVTKNGRPFEIVTERDLIRRYFRDTLLESLAPPTYNRHIFLL